MKLVTVIGARPQFIKAAPVSRALRVQKVEEVLVHTGQHFDDNMSDVFFRELDVPLPVYHLGIAELSHGAMTGRMLEGIEAVLLTETPDRVLVYGDTNSTIAGALAAAKLHIPLAHIEAGVRSFNRRMPEEINRIVTDQVADYLFAPTQAAVENLRREGVQEDRIYRVGDVMLDASVFYMARAQHVSHILDSLKLTRKSYVLATIHREENTDNVAKLSAILDGLGRVGLQTTVVLPVHPRTRKRLEGFGLWQEVPSQIRLINPMGYLDMLILVANAATVLTDSGGLQKEAFFQRVPCVTLREETEWIELVENGFNVVSGTSPDGIAKSYKDMQARQFDWDIELYGNGEAAQAIVASLRFGGRHSP